MAATEARETDELELELRFLKLEAEKTHEDSQAAIAANRETVKKLMDRYESLLIHHIELMNRIAGADPVDEKVEVQTAKTKSSDTEGAQHEGGDPYVVVLVDGNGVNFMDELLRANGAGGAETAHRIHNALQEFFAASNTSLKNFRFVVRVYADLKEVSKKASRAKIINPQPRVLAPFMSSFSQTYQYFDFVDVPGTEMTMVKITGLYQIFNKDPDCKHIFFPAGPNPTYIEMLMDSPKHKVVFVPAGPVDAKYLSLGLETFPFRKVFSRGHRPAPPQPYRASENTSPGRGPNRNGWPRVASTNGNARDRGVQVCFEYQNTGRCSNPNCRIPHPPKRESERNSSITHSSPSKVASNSYREEPEVEYNEGEQEEVTSLTGNLIDL